MDFNTLLTAVLTNGIGGACAAAVLWFAWHRETKTLPQMVDKFAALQQKMLETFAAVQTKTLDTNAEAHEKNLATWTTQAREERADCERRHEENRDRADKLLLDQRDTRHLVANLANQLGLKQAVEAERRKLHHNDGGPAP